MIPIQFITHQTKFHTHEEGARVALEGGCRWIQLRMKNASSEDVKAVAINLRKLCNRYEAMLIINDYAEIVKEVEADGVHLGKSDMPVAEARRLLGEEYIIGGTANTIDDCINLAKAHVDYIGYGPFRFTETKTDLPPLIGLEGYKKMMVEMKIKGISIPVVAIGGIEVEDVESIMQTGISGIAVSGGVLRAENPVERMREFVGM